MVLLTFYTLREMYPDKRIAVIAAILAGVLWENLFYSSRFHTENLALIFELLAIVFFIKGYVRKEPVFKIPLRFSLFVVVVCAILTVLFRPGNIVAFPSFVLFLFLINSGWALETPAKRKRLLIVLGAVVVCGVIILLNLNRIPLIDSYLRPDNPLGWNSLTFFYGLFQSTIPTIPSFFFYAFLLGLGIITMSLWSYYPHIKRWGRSSELLTLKSDVFNLFFHVYTSKLNMVPR
jgi:hypothetical protein